MKAARAVPPGAARHFRWCGLLPRKRGLSLIWSLTSTAPCVSWRAES